MVSTNQNAQENVRGICIICGKETNGTPAKPDHLILTARKLRALFNLKPARTVVDSQHFSEAKQKRACYEKKIKEHRTGAILIFFLLIIGSVIFGKFDSWLFVPAVLGALFVVMLTLVYYFPKFE